MFVTKSVVIKTDQIGNFEAGGDKKAEMKMAQWQTENEVSV